MLRYRRIYSSDIVRIFDVTCAAGRGGCGDLETATRAKVVVPRAGVFAYHFDRRNEFVADANAAIVLRPGADYKISHPVDGGDRCTVFEFDDALFADLSGAVVLSAAGALAARAARGGVLAGASSPAIEEHALTFLEALVGSRAHRHHASVERAKESIAVDPFDDRSLSEIASEVGTSPFHLTRMFRASTGLSLHAYRTQLRLQHGLERTLAGDPLATVAADCGFSSHSRFTEAFRQCFGVVPSHARKLTLPR